MLTVGSVEVEQKIHFNRHIYFRYRRLSNLFKCITIFSNFHFSLLKNVEKIRLADYSWHWLYTLSDHKYVLQDSRKLREAYENPQRLSWIQRQIQIEFLFIQNRPGRIFAGFTVAKYSTRNGYLKYILSCHDYELDILH